MICVYAPEDPGVPFVVTPVVYSDPELCVPSEVDENRKGWVEFDESD